MQSNKIDKGACLFQGPANSLWKMFSYSNNSIWKPSRCIKESFYIPEIIHNFPTNRGFRIKISLKLVWQYMAIFINFSPTLNHLHALQVDNCKFRLERVKDIFFVSWSWKLCYQNGNKQFSRTRVDNLWSVIQAIIQLWELTFSPNRTDFIVISWMWLPVKN